MYSPRIGSGNRYAMVNPGGPRGDVQFAEVVLTCFRGASPGCTPQHNNGAADNRLQSLEWFTPQQQAEDAAT